MSKSTQKPGSVRPPKPGDYEIGRNKPPRHSQFRPGVSGNPGGRKKGCLNFKTMMRELAESEISVTEQGEPRSVPLPKALLLRQVQDGLRGDIRASNSVLDRMERYLCSDVVDDDDLAADDRELLKRALARRHPSDPARGRAPATVPDDEQE